jgi:NodT family efflux transporter outer membrane factor (OMF) lipoprotein
MKSNRFALVAAALTLVLASCNGGAPPTPVPPAPQATGYGSTPPPQTTSANTVGGASQRFLTEMDVSAEWWTLFHSAELNKLIGEALAANPDITAAQAALRNARELYFAQRASAYPNASAQFSISRQQLPTYYSAPITCCSSEYIYGVHTLSLDVGYTPDVFGNLRYQTLSAKAAAEFQRWQVEETYLSLTANVVATAILIAGIQAQIDADNRLIAINRELLNLTIANRRYGQLTELDIANQESALRAAEAAVPPLVKQLDQAKDMMARLVGRTPGNGPASAFTLRELHLPEDLPLTLPSKLIMQRPDVAATEANLAQASADVGVAYTNRLPNLSIDAQIATQSLSLGTLFGPGTLLTMLTGAISQTLYDHGTLKHRESAAVAAYDQAAAQYIGAVLTAIQNVADSVAAISTDADTLRAAALSDAAAQHAFDLTRAQARYGQVSTLEILTAEQAYQTAELALVQAQATRFSDTAALFVALGGGWWNRSETSAQ